MTATPTPGDLSARHVEVLRRMRSDLSIRLEGMDRPDFARHEAVEEASALDYVIAALSALPAAGGAVAWRNHDAAIDAKALATAQEIALMWGQDRSQFVSRIQVAVIDAMRWFDAATTPQPSAAEKVGCEGDDGLLRIHAESETCDVCAAVGAQGDGDAVEHAVDRFLAWPLPKDFGPDCGISFTPLGHPNGWPSGTNLLTAAQAKAMFQHCLAAPAAGKGVDEVLAKLHGLARSINNEDVCHLNASADMLAILQEARFGRNRLEAALTRQPVAGDGDADFELWQDGEFVAGSSGPRAEAWREILHYAAQYEQDGAVTIMEVIRRPLAAPAATPTDGGEGS